MALLFYFQSTLSTKVNILQGKFWKKGKRYFQIVVYLDKTYTLGRIIGKYLVYLYDDRYLEFSFDQNKEQIVDILPRCIQRHTNLRFI